MFEAPTRNAFLFLPDGNTLVCGNSDNMIEFLDVETGARNMMLQGPDGYVSSLAISPNGELLVAGGQDNTYHVWRRVQA
jgi:WD40 repeat protein